MGGYTVRPGDTLGALAARSGVPVAQMAAMNGLDPNRILLAGTPLKLPTGSPVAATATGPRPRRRSSRPRRPNPVPGTLSSSQIGAIAAQHGVPASLASAIAWQESGFNNAMVSSANARGIMQVMPGTWAWVQSNLASTQLNPSSAADNVHAGSLYLGQLLRDTGGDPAMAAAGLLPGPRRRCGGSGCSPRRVATSPTSSRCAAASAAERRGRARASGKASRSGRCSNHLVTFSASSATDIPAHPRRSLPPPRRAAPRAPLRRHRRYAIDP